MPAITFIVVTKRHHQRFFPNDRSGQDETGNCKPGSVFDEGIAHPTLFDFYLQSQAAIKGSECTLRGGHGTSLTRRQSGATCALYRYAERNRIRLRHVCCALRFAARSDRFVRAACSS